ncbi:cytochrome P450 [Bradyrhizobium sp. CIAT3101]|uniref:cytochrome P450 n=1 Tax=Bradyrhizobium sp. CIAT3101 TaxID=439387 RepID=UPI0024B255F0|nr:cytochrome P450 [Bradyrhizobium sp. CIAT3101]WFU80671.1 cytochrome P450 [Bradyrhizobium sp. CIAT3101]
MPGDLVAYAMIRTLINAFHASATSIAWTLMLISGSSVEEALFEEAAAVGPEFDFRNFGSASKLRTALTESLRLYRPAWMQGRHVRTTHIVAEMNIPQGSAVMVCAYSLHRNAKYWNRPGEFLPERFNERSTYDARCYLPFGGGHHLPRIWTVNSNLKLILAYMIWRFRFTVHGIACKPRGLIGLRLHPGLWLKLRPRQ